MEMNGDIGEAYQNTVNVLLQSKLKVFQWKRFFGGNVFLTRLNSSSTAYNTYILTLLALAWNHPWNVWVLYPPGPLSLSSRTRGWVTPSAKKMFYNKFISSTDTGKLFFTSKTLLNPPGSCSLPNIYSFHGVGSLNLWHVAHHLHAHWPPWNGLR